MIEAYCRRQSYVAGDLVEICLSSDSGTLSYTIDRAGVVSERIAAGSCNGACLPVPDHVVRNGCGWEVGLSVPIPIDARSGFYIVTLTAPNGEVGEAFFVLRSTVPSSAILWVIETNTWNAYNTFGGASTYTSGDAGYLDGAPVVSFERPLPKGFISLPANPQRLAALAPGGESAFVDWAVFHNLSLWCGSASWSQWGARFAAWLENQGIEVDYAVNGDLQMIPGLLDGYRLMLSVGHDEYWTWEMRDAVEEHVARGGNVAFFSGNTAYWQVRIEDGGRHMVSYKANVDDDPVMGTDQERRNTGIWSHRLTARPENKMTGVSFTRGGYARIGRATPSSAGGYTIYRTGHWALEETDLAYGDQLGAAHTIVGYECDGCVLSFADGLPYATGVDGTPENFEIIGIAPVALFDHATAPQGLYPEGSLTDVEVVALQVAGDRAPETIARFKHGHAVMGSFTSAGGGVVFTAGTTDWTYGLADPQVSKITLNVIRRLS
jgi:hypothetical protein